MRIVSRVFVLLVICAAPISLAHAESPTQRESGIMAATPVSMSSELGDLSNGDSGGCVSSSCCCQSQCDCCAGWQDGLLGGFIKRSDTCYNDFVSPMTNPVFFEDPRTLTEARAIYIRHKVPLAATGGEINLFACQLRAALSDRLSFIATKDGYLTSSNGLIDDGWADLNAGLKYNLFADPCSQQLVSAGLTYELPVGSTRSRQGNGDGLFNLFLTAGTEIGENGHWISASGLLLPADTAAESSIWFWSNHFDHRIGCSNVYAVAEFNWYHYMGSGRAFGLPLEGGDLFNLGSIGVAGNDIVTGALGLKFKPVQKMEVGVAWELPLTEREDVLDNRLTVDCIFRF